MRGMLGGFEKLTLSRLALGGPLLIVAMYYVYLWCLSEEVLK